VSPENVIAIELEPAPKWGKTAHEATLTCPHGTNHWTVFGDVEERMAMARQMAPAHRSQARCRCELAP
jgi:hypothetical protein